MAKVVVANDHGAVALTARLIARLKERGFDVTYLGVDHEESVDYPDKAKEAAEEFLKGGYDFGVLCCGTGIGISMSANKIKGILCALPQNIYAARMAKEHNAANFIAFGGRIEYPEDPVKMLDAYIDAEVSPEVRHANRRKKMCSLEC